VCPLFSDFKNTKNNMSPEREYFLLTDKKEFLIANKKEDPKI
jgi:hypothetical protein